MEVRCLDLAHIEDSNEWEILVLEGREQYGYPPDKRESAVVLVIRQAELFAGELMAA